MACHVNCWHRSAVRCFLTQPAVCSLHFVVLRVCTICIGFAARKLWKSYFPSVDAVVYLIDANDKERFPEAKKELDVRGQCFQGSHTPPTHG